MNVPTIPTDNLYKFCAIAGLVLLLFGIVYPLQQTRDLQLELLTQKTAIDVTGQRIENLKADIAKHKKEVEHAASYIDRIKKQATISDEQTTKLRQLATKMDKHTNELVLATRQIQLKVIQQRGGTQKSRVLVDHLILMSILCGISMFAGLGLASYGFRRWYTLVQVPQDRVLLQNASKIDS